MESDLNQFYTIVVVFATSLICFTHSVVSNILHSYVNPVRRHSPLRNLYGTVIHDFLGDNHE